MLSAPPKAPLLPEPGLGPGLLGTHCSQTKVALEPQPQARVILHPQQQLGL